MEDRLNSILSQITDVSQESRDDATAYIETIAMPPWALGRLLDLAVDLAGIQGKTKPTSGKKMIFTMAADHGVAEEGVSPYPQDVTVQMTSGILLGKAGVNSLASQTGAGVKLVDMGIKEDIKGFEDNENFIVIKVQPGSNNIHKGPAMTREQAAEAVVRAYEAVSKAIEEEDVEILGTGELGIGNTTPATAILSVMADVPVEEVTGRGSGLDDEGLNKKIEIIKESIALNNPNPEDALDVLSKIGGYDIAGIAGTILAAAAHKKPVLVDGFISTAGALIAYGLSPKSAQYMIPSHRSVEPGHDKMWDELGKEPLLDLNMRLGEGTGAAVAMHLIDCACEIVNNMATFEEGGVSDSDIATKENFE